MIKQLGLTVVCLSLISLNAQAAQEVECYRHNECPGEQLCINTVCEQPQEALQECEESGDCDGAECVEGFCKEEGVYCENPAGHCYYESNQSRCSCETGQGSASASAGSDSSEQPIELTDAQLYEQCQENLSMDCGDEAPDIHDECTDAQLDTCTTFYETANEILISCDQEPFELDYFQLASCCRDSDDEDFTDTFDCIMDLDSDDCEGLEECLPYLSGETSGTSREDWNQGGGAGISGGTEDPDSDDDKEISLGEGSHESVGGGESADDADDEAESDSEDKDDDGDDDDSGCSVSSGVGRSSNAPLSILVLLFGIIVSRYRRRQGGASLFYFSKLGDR
jgi:hypothetical protein